MGVGAGGLGGGVIEGRCRWMFKRMMVFLGKAYYTRTTRT